MSVNSRPDLTAPRITLGRVSTADAIVNELSEEILDGSLAAGTHLREVEVADRFGVSRQSVRAALAELSFRGLARREPHRGVRIPTLTREDAEDIYYLREVIEGAAVRRIARDQARLDGVEDAVRMLERLSSRARWSDVAEADVAIHRALVAAAESPRLLQASDRFSGEMLLVLVPARRYMSLARMVREHRELLEVIRGGDPEVAVTRLRQHLELGTEDLLANLPRSGA